MRTKLVDFPKVYILILNWNGWKDTIECLESVFRNTYPNYQVIVIDNGSTNGSMEKIKAWAEGKQEVLTPDPSHPLYHLSHPPVQKPIPYIEYDRKTVEVGGLPEKEKELYNNLPNGIPHPLILIQTGDNLGFAGGNNVGIKYALSKNDCEYVWLLNNDTVIDAEALRELIKTAMSDTSIGMVGSKICYYKNPLVIQMAGGGKFYILFGTAKNIGIGNEEEKSGMREKFEEPDYIGGASLLIPVSIIEQIGLMDEGYFMYLEDLEWGLRARKAGFRLIYCPHSKLWHKGGASCEGFMEGRFLWRKKIRPTLDRFVMDCYGYRNWIYLYKKYFPHLMPFVLCRLLYKAAEILLYGDDHKFIRERMLICAVWNGLKGNMGA